MLWSWFAPVKVLSSIPSVTSFTLGAHRTDDAGPLVRRDSLMPFDPIRAVICALHKQHRPIEEAFEVMTIAPMEARTIKGRVNAHAAVIEIALVVVSTPIWIVASIWIKAFQHLVGLSVCVWEPDKHELFTSVAGSDLGTRLCRDLVPLQSCRNFRLELCRALDAESVPGNPRDVVCRLEDLDGAPLEYQKIAASADDQDRKLQGFDAVLIRCSLQVDVAMLTGSEIP